jgi:hypothetical protein
MWFWSHDHNPPHFHAKIEGAWEVQVFFLESTESMFRLKWKKRPFLSRYRKALLEQVMLHRAEILREWESKVQPE